MVGVAAWEVAVVVREEEEVAVAGDAGAEQVVEEPLEHSLACNSPHSCVDSLAGPSAGSCVDSLGFWNLGELYS